MDIAMPAGVLPDYFERLESRIRQEFEEDVATWEQSVTALSHWESEHLIDNASAEDVAGHRRTRERLIRFGRSLALTTGHTDFPDSKLKETVAATLQTLGDKIHLWHGRMPKAEPTRFSRPPTANEFRTGAVTDRPLRMGYLRAYSSIQLRTDGGPAA